MNLHFQILLWLSIIFIVAGAIILAIMLKTKKKRKILFRFYGYFLNFRLCNAHLYIYFWYIINFNFTFMNKILQNSIDVLNFNENCLHFVTQLQSRN